MTATPVPGRERFVTHRNGGRLLVCDWGDSLDPRTPLLGLPGYARTAKDFAHLAERYAPRRLVSFDYRGRGRSDYEADWRRYAPATMLDDVKSVMVALGLHRCVAVGTSFGGLLAMGLAAVAPTALAGVVLNDVGPDVEAGGGDMLIEVMGKERRHTSWQTAMAELQGILPDMSLRGEAEWMHFTRNTYREEPDGSIRQDWDPQIVKPLVENAGSQPNLWPLFTALSAFPTLLVRGGKSIVLSGETAQRMQERHPGMRSVVLPEVGHAPTLEEPEIRAELDGFLAAL